MRNTNLYFPRRCVLWLTLLALGASFGRAQTASQVFPFFADGKLGSDIWQTELLIANAGPIGASVTLNFHFEPQNEPTVQIDGVGPVTQLTSLIVPQNGSILVRTTGSSSTPFAVGWVEVVSSIPIRGQALFRRHAGDGEYYEGSVPLVAPPSKTFSLAFDGSTYTNGALFSTGIAMANTNPVIPAQISCVAYDSDGNVLSSLLPIDPLPGSGHIIIALETAFASILGTKQGNLDCAATQPVAVVGLRFFGVFALSSVPVTIGD